MISNAVDATNFAWLAMGQPTHAFDLDKIEGGSGRRARKGEKLKTLDGVDRVLDADDLVVADHARALGLAGVMGGWDTMITPETKNVLVEAAWFVPMVVRQTARRHGLHTDASHRFERGADFNAAPVASALVSAILLANGGSIEGELVDVRVAAIEERTAHRKPIVLELGEVRRILGKTVDKEGITAGTIDGIMTALGCGLAAAPAGDSWQVTLPSWRLDLEREIDLMKRSRASTAITALRIRCRHLAKACGRCHGRRRKQRCAARCWRLDFMRPSQVRFVPRLRPRSLRRSRGKWCRLEIHLVKRRVYYVPRWCPECWP